MQRNILFQDCLVLFIASSTNLFCEHAKKYPVSRLSSALHSFIYKFVCEHAKKYPVSKIVQCSSQLHLQICFVSMQRNILSQDCLVLFIASSTNLFCKHAKKYPVSRLSSALHSFIYKFVLLKEISCKIVLLFIASSTNLFCKHAKKYPVSRLPSALHSFIYKFGL